MRYSFSHSLRLATATLCVAAGGAAQAADSQGLYQTLYFVPCPAYAEHRKEAGGTGNNALDQIYIAGWLSGFNYLTPNTYDILPSHDVPGVMKWMDEFCKKNPTKSLDAGLLQLSSDLYPQRMQEFAKVNAPVEATGTASKTGLEQSKFVLPGKKADATPTAKQAAPKP